MSDDNPSSPNPQIHRLVQLKIDRNALSPIRKKRLRWKKWLLMAVVLLAAAGFFLMPRPQSVQVTSVLTSYPSQQYTQLTASGYVVAQRRAAIASKATGRLLWLSVREGSQVKENELIARLDASDVQAAIASAQAGIAQAGASLAQARAQSANALNDLKRSRGMVAQNFISPQAVDAAQTKFDAANATVAAMQAALSQAKAQLRIQQVNLENTEIRAPFDGVVLAKNANVGDMIAPFSSAANSLGAVVTMADMRTLEVETDVSESNVAKVKPDQPAVIMLDAIPDVRFRGSVSRIVPTVDRAKATVTTKVRFEQLDSRVLPEMSAKVDFLSQRPSDADQQTVMAVNPKAITERDGKKVVLRIHDNMLEAVPVQIGRTLGEVVEIRGAIKPADKLVLEPHDTLQTGSKIDVAGKSS